MVEHNKNNIKVSRRSIMNASAAAEIVAFLRIFATHLLNENSRAKGIKSRKKNI